MSSFTDASLTKVSERPLRVRVDAADGVAMVFWIGAPDGPTRITIPHGFICDGPSLTFWPTLILRCLGLLDWVLKCLAKAAIVHDWMRRRLEFSLADSDALFFVAMKADCKNWRGPRLAKTMLRWIAFVSVCNNSSRD